MSHNPRSESTRLWMVSRALTVILIVAALMDIPQTGQAQVETPSPDITGEPVYMEEPAENVGSEVPADWLSQVQEDLTLAEYNITWQEQTYLEDLPAAFQAPNRANNLRTYFTPQGTRVIPRSWLDEIPDPPWEIELALAGWGREGATSAPTPAAPEVTGNTFEYQHAEGIERYRNDENGLNLEFFLSSPLLTGEQPVQIQLSIQTSLAMQLHDSAKLVEFHDSQGQAVVRYSRLSAVDAAGISLPAWMSVEGNLLSLFVQDTGAVYPILISSALSSLSDVPDWSETYTSPDSRYGFGVATAGDVNKDGYSDVIVSMPTYDNGQADEGMVLVYRGTATGIDGTAIWYMEGDQAYALYGSSVSTAGDVDGDGDCEIIIGASTYNDNFVDGGSVWVFYGSPSGLSITAGEYYQGVLVSAHLGVSVAPAGDVNGDGYGDIIIGSARAHDSFGQDEEGFAQVYYGSSSGLADTTSWRAEGEQFGALLGYSVSGAGDVNGDGIADVIAGAPGYDDGQNNEGKAFVWHGSLDGPNGGITGTPTNADWEAASDNTDAGFGFSVSTAGDVNGDGYADVVVGAPYFTNGQDDEGAVRLYLGSDSGLDSAHDNHDEGNSPNAQLGHSVAVAGDVNGDGYADIIAGAPYYSDNLSNQGAAYLWMGSAAGISVTRDWDALGTVAIAMFGTKVATAGDVNGDGYSDIIVGAPGEASYAGSVYAYYGGPDTLQEKAGWQAFSGMSGASYGYSVGAAGDVNGDGYGDVIVGAPGWDDGQDNEGAAWVYLGGATGLNTTAQWFKDADQVGASFGWSVGKAGDVNGDGYGDIIVGSPYYDYDQEDEGMAWVYLGSNAGIQDSPSWIKDSDQTFALFGFAVGTAGDVNGDGLSDVMVGAPFWNDGQTDEGGVWVYHGATTAFGLNTSPDWYMQLNAANTEFGAALGTAGDVNRDGFSDIIIGARDWDNGQQDEGGAWVFTGSKFGLSSTYAWHQEGGQIDASYGYSVGTAGDVNGDGFSDIIIGAPHTNVLLADEGAAYVYNGSGTGLGTIASWSKRGNLENAEFGWSVGTAGDTNGDGYADILASAHFWTAGQPEEGGAWLYEGSSSGVHSAPDWYAQGNQDFAWFGGAVASAGDVNGDAYADVIVGSIQFDDAIENEGAAFLYYGNGRKGVPMRLYQRKSGGAHIAQLGLTANKFFWVGIRHFNTFGRCETRMKTETKPLNALFDGETDTIRLTVWDNYITGTGYYWDASPMNAPLGIPFHWRSRLLYNPSSMPFMPASRWFTIPWNGWNETKLRTYGASIYLPIVVAD